MISRKDAIELGFAWNLYSIVFYLLSNNGVAFGRAMRLYCTGIRRRPVSAPIPNAELPLLSCWTSWSI